MGLKKLKLSVPASKKPNDPLEVFNKLTLRGSIENIWEPQAEALREWSKARTNLDVVIQMNTGGGKTLVGMMVAQSLLNELNRRVLYVVPNNQLVEQTLRKAAEVGLQPAARFKGQWRNQEAFQAAETFCITNYAAVFTGHSTFHDKDIAALVFDDAHVAEGTIRDQFTIKIASGSDLFNEVVALLSAPLRQHDWRNKTPRHHQRQRAFVALRPHVPCLEARPGIACAARRSWRSNRH